MKSRDVGSMTATLSSPAWAHTWVVGDGFGTVLGVLLQASTAATTGNDQTPARIVILQEDGVTLGNYPILSRPASLPVDGPRLTATKRLT
ncbi:MAG: hypothetical protein V3T16_04355, partial [Gemmatimonadales bacterium]